MDTKYLLQLSLVLDKGSISEASRHLAISQPTLTRNMATLEQQAGGQLFTRSRFGVRSTPLGERLGREGRAIAARMGVARDIVSRYRLGIRGELRLGIGPLAALGLMPALAMRLLPLDSRMSLSVRCDAPNRLLDVLIDGELDILIGQPIGVSTVGGFRAIPMLDDEIVPYCSVDHELAGRPDISVADLADRDWIVQGSSTHFERGTLEMLGEIGVHSLNTQLTTSGDTRTLLSVLAQGRHIAMLPRLLMQESIATYRLHELPLKPARRALHHVALWHPQALESDPGLEMVVRAVRERFDEIAGAADA